MPITTWIAVTILNALVITIAGFFLCDTYSSAAKIIGTLVTIAICVTIILGFHWYYANTAAGQRAMVDQKSNLQNGIERIVTVYTADGKQLAQYKGKIDISDNDGYVKFDFDGKRYIYYNCFVESIADIE
nr:MAG TPA: protein of unknown function (DUF5052) [Caudoviricetes sp.]